MNKLLAALIAGAFVSVAAAQTAMPKATTMEKQETSKAVTGQQGVAMPNTKDAAKATNPDNPTGTAGTAEMQKATSRASRDVAKMTRMEKEAFAKEINRTMINPDNPSGSVSGTANMQKETTAVSKTEAKDRPNLNAPGAQKALEKASTK